MKILEIINQKFENFPIFRFPDWIYRFSILKIHQLLISECIYAQQLFDYLLWQSFSSSTIVVVSHSFGYSCLLRCTKKLLDLFFQKMEIKLFTSYNLYQSKNADDTVSLCLRGSRNPWRGAGLWCSKLTIKCSGYRIEEICELYSWFFTHVYTYVQRSNSN